MKNIVVKLFLVCLLIIMLFSFTSCLGTANLVEEHSFSNLVIDGNTLWFGAGYKLYRLNLNQMTAEFIFNTKNIVISFVEIYEGSLYFGGNPSPNGRQSVIWALDLDNENILWKREINLNLSGGGFVTPPLIDKEVLMIGARQNFYGLDRINGDIKWQIENNWFGTGELLTPILVDKQLIYGEYKIGQNGPQSDHTIAIADLFTGNTVRTISMSGRLGSVPVFHNGYLFVKDYEYYKNDDTGKLQWIGELRLNCLELNSGKLIWTFQGDGVPESSQPVFYNGLVIDVFANQLYAIDEKTGELYWKSPELDSAVRNPQVIKGLGIVGAEIIWERKMVFLDLRTGELRTEMLLNTLSSPIFIDNEAIYGTTNAIIRVDISTGKMIWSIPVDSHYLTQNNVD